MRKAIPVLFVLALAGCSTDARDHPIMTARLEWAALTAPACPAPKNPNDLGAQPEDQGRVYFVGYVNGPTFCRVRPARR